MMLVPFTGLGLRRIEPRISSLNTLHREMDRWFRDMDERRATSVRRDPGFSVQEEAERVLIRLEAPGLAEEDLHVSIDREVLTIRGERRLAPPEGFDARRRERRNFALNHRLSLPCKVDAENASASLEHGVLTLTLPKQAEAQPRRIPILTTPTAVAE